MLCLKEWLTRNYSITLSSYLLKLLLIILLDTLMSKQSPMKTICKNLFFFYLPFSYQAKNGETLVSRKKD